MAKHSEQTRPKLDFNFDLSRKGRGTYDQDEFVFRRGDEPYKGSAGQLRLNSRKGGDRVQVKLFSDLDGDGRFAKDELIFRGTADGEGIFERLEGSTGKVRWNYSDCTPCLRVPFSFLTLNPAGSDKVDFFSVGSLGTMNGISIGEQVETL